MTAIAAISFLSPLMLAGSALVALPIIAHLLSRRTRRRIVFPTVRLLRQSSASTSRLFRLRRWLTLLLRCLAVVLIAWAFARPVWRERAAPTIDSGGVAVVLLLDTSASVSQSADGVSVVNSVGALAERTLNSLEGQAAMVGIVYASAQPRAAFPELTGNLDVIRKELDALKPTRERADFPQAVATAGKLLAKHTGQRRLVILSDMQRSNWSDVTLESSGRQLLPEGTILTILPVGPDDNENVSLSDPRSLPLQPIAGQPVRMVVRLSNYGPSPRKVRVRASADGLAFSAIEVDVKAWSGREVQFETSLADVGQHRVVFSVEQDSMACDNAAYMTVNVVRRAAVVVVGDDNPDQSGSSTFFLIRALAPAGDLSDDLDVKHLTSGDLTYARIAEAESVYVGYVGKLSARAVKALYVYASQGGAVVVFCGGGPVEENLLALRGAAGKDSILPWHPGPVRDLARDGDFLRIGQGAWDRPPLTDFDQASQAALKQVRFARVWSAGAARDGTTTHLEYTDGTAAMSSHAVGAGTLVVCNFSPSHECSDIGKYGGFPGLMRAMFSHLRPRREQYGRAVAGEPFSYPATVQSSAGPAQLTVLGPDERPCLADVAGEGGQVLVHFRRPALPGFYSILSGGKTVAVAAVNVDPREGDLRRADPDVLLEHLSGQRVTVRMHDSRTSGPILRIRGTALWPWFVVGAMCAVALELILLCLWKQ